MSHATLPPKGARPDAPSTRPAIELHIEQLVLEGFAPADRDRIGAALTRELERLIAERGLTGRMAGGERIDGGSFAVATGAGPEAIGTQVARAVYGGIGR